MLNCNEMKVLFSSKNSEILHIEDTNILVIKFIGNMTDEAYFEIWEKVLLLAVAKESKRLIVDQLLGEPVSFAARSKVVRVYLQQYKKNIGNELKVGVLMSANNIYNAGAKYLVEIFRSQTSFKIKFFSEKGDAIKWLTNTP